MTAPTVTTVQIWDQLTVNGVALSGVRVTVQAVYAGLATYIGATPYIAASQPQTTTTDGTGYWTLNVVPTDLLNPTGYTYEVIPESGAPGYQINPTSVGVPGGGWKTSNILVLQPQGAGPLPTLTVSSLSVTGLLSAASAAISGLLTAVTAAFQGPCPYYDVTHPHWGADPTGATDSAPAIQAALDAANATGVGGIVSAPPNSVFQLNSVVHAGSVLWVGNKVELRLGPRDSTRLFLGTSPSVQNLPMVTLGIPGSSSLVFNSLVTGGMLDCGDVVGSVGAFTQYAQEKSGLKSVFIKAPQVAGFQSTGGQNYVLDGLEVIGSASTPASMVPIDINSASGSPYALRDLSLVAVAGHEVTTAMKLDGVSGLLVEALHVEHCTDGILIGSRASTSNLTTLRVDGGPTCTNVIHVSNAFASTGYTFIDTWRHGAGTTNTILDDNQGYTIVDAACPPYSVGAGTPPNSSVFVLDNSVGPRLRVPIRFNQSAGRIYSTGTLPTLTNVHAQATASSVIAKSSDMRGTVSITLNVTGAVAGARLFTLNFAAAFGDAHFTVVCTVSNGQQAYVVTNSKATGTVDVIAGVAMANAIFNIDYIVVGAA